eukprot:CAMPEP_0198278510 /NCGR_PEP_ID=MMETSP1447-20131203/66418_1 /TAXON_ID=420782 /ORGANISM="Chaetoceros dichaeta, Strain CCMP1751" /LENGTH=267 /DNA_ID=CAMNT_0043973595 /DNA_START=246 /DNA_END=1052 /DNA_ORIENTATION=+
MQYVLLLLTIIPHVTNGFAFTTTVSTCRISSSSRHTSPLSSSSSSRNQYHPFVLRMVDGGDEDSNDLSFDDAAQALKDQEDTERMENRGNEMDEENKTFEGNKGTYDDMRAKIRARTTDLSMEKSVTTAEAIKAATNRAMAGEAAATPTVDLSKFNDALLENPEDELTDEQKAEIDTVGQLNLWEQAVAEYKYTRFPTAGASLKQAGLMVVIFAVTATVILKVDELLRFQYTDWGLIPRSGEIMDYSDLTLPEGFTDQMNDEDLSKL